MRPLTTHRPNRKDGKAPDVMRGDNWRDFAACQSDPALFFPVGNTGPALLQIEKAKAVCRRCPVLRQCGECALANPRLAEHGVWGGMSEDDRRSIHRKAARTGTTPAMPAPASHSAKTVTALREQVVRDLWTRGLSDKAIARQTGISQPGVGKIRNRLGLLPHTAVNKKAA